MKELSKGTSFAVKLALMVPLFFSCFSFTFSTNSPLRVSAEEEQNRAFSVEPAEVSFTFKRISTAQSEFILDNPLDFDLLFELRPTEQTTNTIAENNLSLSYPENIITVASGEQTTVVIEVKPDELIDFDTELLFVLEQIVEERKLAQTEYEIKLNINSELESTRQRQQEELVIGGISLAAILIVLTVVFFVPIPRLRGGSKQRKEGQG
ncbi:MAG: hypothetical protein ACOCXP_01035 [Candidatus Dojkabacteria bacterium]